MPTLLIFDRKQAHLCLWLIKLFILVPEYLGSQQAHSTARDKKISGGILHGREMVLTQVGNLSWQKYSIIMSVFLREWDASDAHFLCSLWPIRLKKTRTTPSITALRLGSFRKDASPNPFWLFVYIRTCL